MRSLLRSSILSAGVAFISSATAGVVITRGDVDAFAQAVSGRQGSSSGVMLDDPPLIGGLSGRIELHPGTSAGPVSPGKIPSTPGTDGVVSVTGDAVIEFTQTGSELAVDLLTACQSDMMNMDGGTYLGSANGFVDLRFTVTAPTPFVLTGNVAFDDQSATSYVLFTGGTLGNIVVRFGPGGNGPVNNSGVLGAGDYRLEMVADVFEVPINGGNVGAFSESGLGELRLVMNPNANFAVGDMNCDGILSVSDIAPFVLALTTPAAYPVSYPTCDIDLADVNHDGIVSVGDIGDFVELLTGA